MYMIYTVVTPLKLINELSCEFSTENIGRFFSFFRLNNFLEIFIRKEWIE